MLTNTLGIFDISQSDELLEIHGHKSFREKISRDCKKPHFLKNLQRL